MAAAKLTLPVEYLHECFNYHPETGELTWKQRPREHFKCAQGWKTFNTRSAGKVAGSMSVYGYLRINLNKTFYNVHRIAWAMFYGEWPSDQIDHINRDRRDNRIANLRPATNSENNRNRVAQSNNTSGFKGVCYHKASKKYMATVNTTYLGLFPTAELAYAACCAAREAIHGEFVNHG